MKVQLFIPCFVDQLYPNVGMNTVKILEKVGCEVIYNPNQTCCGQPAYNSGFEKEACKVSEKFLQDFEGVDYIVAPSGSCVGYVRNTIPELFEHHTEKQKSISTAKRIFELSEFLVDVLKIEDLGATFETTATYHDACGALRECGIKSSPRKLLENVKGLNLVEMAECETCCGFGGTFAIKYEPISIGMAQTKIASAQKVEAECIISTDISCLMHLEGYIKNQKAGIDTLHLADVLVMGW